MQNHLYFHPYHSIEDYKIVENDSAFITQSDETAFSIVKGFEIEVNIPIGTLELF